MILVHRLRGNAVWLNPDLVESVEENPDTIITLVDGRRAVVSDSVQDVLDRIREYRASVIVAAEAAREHRGPVLRVVPDEES